MKVESSRPPESTETRRSFLRKAAVAAAAASSVNFLRTPVYGQSQAPSANVTGANNRIVVGYIGCGAQGMAHVGHQKQHAQENNIVQAAVCDLYEKRLNVAKNTLGLADADCFAVHEKLLARKDIDAVVIATVDDWHAQCTIDALEAGKHVFARSQ